MIGKFGAAFDDRADRRQLVWGSDKGPTAVPAAARNNEANHSDDAMCEIIDFLDPSNKRVWPHLLMANNSRPEAGVISPAFAEGSELLRQNLCAELTTLNHYGLGGISCALVDGLSALAVRSRRAVQPLSWVQWR